MLEANTFEKQMLVHQGRVAAPNRMKKVIPVYGTGQGTKTDEFSERFQMAVDPHTLPLRMVPITGNHVHAFHTIWPSYLLAYIRPYPL